MEKRIYLITGIMASGKSTVSELLASRLRRCVHLRGDVFRKMIVSGREEMCEAPTEEAVAQLHLRYKLTAEAARTYYDNGFSVVIQDNYYGEDLNFMLALLKGYPVRLVVLCPSVETVKERERNRGKTGYTGFSVEVLYDIFMRETPHIGFWLDTTAMSPLQSVEEILRHNSQASSGEADETLSCLPQ